jgi:hypothetical protein
MLREADLQVGRHPRHGVDRDRDSFTAPDVALLEQDMRHTAITAVDDEPFDVADLAVARTNPVAAMDVYLPEGNGLVGSDLAAAQSGKGDASGLTRLLSGTVVGGNESCLGQCSGMTPERLARALEVNEFGRRRARRWGCRRPEVVRRNW